MNGPHRERKGGILAAVLDSLRESAAIIGMEKEIVAANAFYQARYSKTPHSSPLHCYEVIHGYSRPCSQEGERCPIQISAESGKPCQIRHYHLGLHGKNQEMIRVHPVRDSSGDIAAFFQILRSVDVVRPLVLSQIGGVSLVFKQMLESIEKLASIDAPVLIKGERGSGRELVARALHRMSPHSRNPFVPMDCTGVKSERVLQMELYGKESPGRLGVSAQRGLVEVAQGGSLFLSDVGNLGLRSQIMLLVFVETSFFCRLEGSRLRSAAEVRLLCSTECNLEQRVEERTFNRDLYEQISRYSITVPPLRERMQDLPILVGNLLHHLSRGRITSMSPAALAMLRRHCFPGNIRELSSILEHASLFAEGSTVLPEHLPPGYQRDPDVGA